MITRRFARKIHSYFDEFNFYPKDVLDIDNFYDAFAKTLTHCASLEDAAQAILMAQYFTKKRKKIEKMFLNKKAIYDEYEYRGNSLLALVSDEDALGKYYVTNGLTNNNKELYLIGKFGDEDCIIEIKFKDGKYFIDNDSYYLTNMPKSETKMRLFDKKNNYMCNVVLSEDYFVFLEDNFSPFEIVLYEGGMVVYDREYYNSVKDNEKLDFEKAIAMIQWDLLDKNSDFGVSKITLFKDLDTDDFGFICLIASSTFILYERYMREMNSGLLLSNAISRTFTTNALLNNIRK